MLYHCFWADNPSDPGAPTWPTLLVDANDAETAERLGTKYNGGARPSLVTPMRAPAAGFVLAEVHFDADEADDDDDATESEFDIVNVTVTEEVSALLAKLEDAGLDTAGDVEAVDETIRGICGDAIQESEGGPTLVCTLDDGHAGDHEGKDPKGEAVAWPRN